MPSSDADRSILRERDFRINTKIRADLKQPRNPRFNGLVHGLGRVLSQNIDRFSGKQSHDAIKALQLESGVYCDEESFDIPGLGQLTRKTPRSLSYDSMGRRPSKTSGVSAARTWCCMTGRHSPKSASPRWPSSKHSRRPHEP